MLDVLADVARHDARGSSRIEAARIVLLLAGVDTEAREAPKELADGRVVVIVQGDARAAGEQAAALIAARRGQLTE